MKKICRVCNKEYVVTRVRDAKTRRTCGIVCRRKDKSTVCKFCKKRFKKTLRKGEYCSDDCLNNKGKLRLKQKRDKEASKREKFRSKAKFGELKDGLVNWEDKVLTLKNYKEPLTKIDGGYGWYGTIACTIDGSQIQCHICGKLVESLPGHINNTHKINTREYKEKFGLQYGSALVSEKIRMREKQRTLDYLKTLTEEEKKAWRQQKGRALNDGRKLRSKAQPKKTLEQMNKEDGCPDQTLDKIKQVKEKIGHVPSKDEFIDEMGGQRYIHLVYKHFGSWNKAIEMCHFDAKDDKRYEAKDRGQIKRRYTDDELLEYLRIYAEENRQIPTVTDFRRGILPDYKCYTSRFKTIENARQLAGVYEFVDPDLDDFNKSKSKYYRHLFRKGVKANGSV